MPARDPTTGQFVSSSDPYSGFDDVETVADTREFHVDAAALAGATGPDGGEESGFQGVEAYPMSNIIDRGEQATLLEAYHVVEAWMNPTQTADGMARAAIEISSSPSHQAVRAVDALQDVDDVGWLQGDADLPIQQSGPSPTRSLDLVGPPLVAYGYAPFSDGATGNSGSGSSEQAKYQGTPADPQFHHRDDLFINGVLTAFNVADSAIHATVRYYHAFGIEEDR